MKPVQPTYTHFQDGFLMTCSAQLEVIAFNAASSHPQFDQLRDSMLSAVAGMIEGDRSAPKVIWRLTVNEPGLIHWFFDSPSELLRARKMAKAHAISIINDDWCLMLPRGEIVTSADEFEDISLFSRV